MRKSERGGEEHMLNEEGGRGGEELMMNEARGDRRRQSQDLAKGI